MSEHEIRYSLESDLPFLFDWLSSPEDLQFYPMSEGKELEQFARNWIGFSRYKCSLTALDKDKPCGIGTLYLMPYRKVAHHCLFYMIVDKDYRRQGVGTSLVKNLLNLAKNYFSLESVHAEAFEGSPIIPLLEKNGFESFATQEHFLKVEDKYLARILLEHRF